MEIKVVKEKELGNYDDGYRDVTAKIAVDPKMHPRRQRQTLFYEVLGALLDPFELNGELIECLADALVDALDQLENNENSET